MTAIQRAARFVIETPDQSYFFEAENQLWYFARTKQWTRQNWQARQHGEAFQWCVLVDASGNMVGCATVKD